MKEMNVSWERVLWLLVVAVAVDIHMHGQEHKT